MQPTPSPRATIVQSHIVRSPPRLLLCLAVVWLAGLGACDKPPPAISSQPSPVASEVEPVQRKPVDGTLHARIASGSILRAAPNSSAQAVRVLANDAILKVLAENDGWFRVAHPEADADADAEALWIAEGDRARRLVLSTPWLPKRPAVTVDPETHAAARQLMTDPREHRCGPYPLLTDVRRESVLEACDRLARGLDRAYELQFGVRPLVTAANSDAETIFLFAKGDAFRRFVSQHGDSRLGYAGHAVASRGYLVLWLGDRDDDTLLTTLVHELSHLINWRALGGPLPRWLSEGLAESLGDRIEGNRLRPLGDTPSGPSGVLGKRRRLLDGYQPGQPAPSIERLAGLSAGNFDSQTESRDYEHSALMVRFLLVDPQLSSRFHSFLEELSNGRRYRPERLREHLGVDWQDIDRRFHDWLS